MDCLLLGSATRGTLVAETQSLLFLFFYFIFLFRFSLVRSLSLKLSNRRMEVNTNSFDGETNIPEPIMVPTIRATPLKSPTLKNSINQSVIRHK